MGLRVLAYIRMEVVDEMHLKRCMKKMNPFKRGVYEEVKRHWVYVKERLHTHKIFKCNSRMDQLMVMTLDAHTTRRMPSF